ncbi:ArsR/SmtB family transcription factor [Clostridium akagii]|uniref:ArsR/SmtB family transcription factor n=1 Tax=Clostridium akagii TaxID=91623 RepID=UPI00047AB49E|nr:metalloregulator ArsR/SmtB family transcription factor [Clostridium akagii]
MKKDNDYEHILELFRESVPVFDVLSDVTRQNIIMLLADKKYGLNVNTITELMPLSRPGVSHHLKVLKQAGIVDNKKSGTENYYFLTLKEPIDRLKDLITSIENSCTLK